MAFPAKACPDATSLLVTHGALPPWNFFDSRPLFCILVR
jgi:hypothetical protein